MYHIKTDYTLYFLCKHANITLRWIQPASLIQNVINYTRFFPQVFFTSWYKMKYFMIDFNTFIMTVLFFCEHLCHIISSKLSMARGGFNSVWHRWPQYVVIFSLCRRMLWIGMQGWVDYYPCYLKLESVNSRLFDWSYNQLMCIQWHSWKNNYIWIRENANIN